MEETVYRGERYAGYLVVSGNLWHQLQIATAPATSVPAGLGIAGDPSDKILAAYAKLRKEANRRAGLGDDRMSFVTPDAPAVASLVQELTGGYSEDPAEYWKDIEVLYRWVTQNIEYYPDTYAPLLPEFIGDELTWVNDFWRMPEETLKDRVGDCDDMVTLLVSMLMRYNQQRYAVWAIEIGNKERGHVGVALPVGKGMLTILDPTIRYATGSSESGIGSKPTATALGNWLARWSQELPGAEVRAVFNSTFCKEFGSTQEFLVWAGN